MPLPQQIFTLVAYAYHVWLPTLCQTRGWWPHHPHDWHTEILLSHSQGLESPQNIAAVIFTLWSQPPVWIYWWRCYRLTDSNDSALATQAHGEKKVNILCFTLGYSLTLLIISYTPTAHLISQPPDPTLRSHCFCPTANNKKGGMQKTVKNNRFPNF
jgi:hypothetical protein